MLCFCQDDLVALLISVSMASGPVSFFSIVFFTSSHICTYFNRDISVVTGATDGIGKAFAFEVRNIHQTVFSNGFISAVLTGQLID